MENVNKSGGRKRRIILIVVGIILVAAIAAAIYYFGIKPHTSGTDASTAPSPSAKLDTRTEAAKTATADAQSQAQGGDTNAAYATIDAAIAANGSSSTSDSVDLYQSKAVIAVNAGQKDAAIAAQNKAISLDPTNSDLYQALGDIYTAFDDTAGANQAYAKATDLAAKNPNSSSYHGTTAPSN